MRIVKYFWSRPDATWVSTANVSALAKRHHMQETTQAHNDAMYLCPDVSHILHALHSVSPLHQRIVAVYWQDHLAELAVKSRACKWFPETQFPRKHAHIGWHVVSVTGL